jgi:NhaP-type Na+/H+ or K+/H+ antiporter
MDETRGLILYVFLAQFCTVAAFTWIYLRGREEKPWLAQGIRYGIAVAVLVTIPINLSQYATMPLPLDFVLKRMCYDVATVILLGVVVAWLNRGATSRYG